MLSNEMSKCLLMIEKHGKLVRYEGGFWAEEGAVCHPLTNAGKFICYVPNVYVGTNTIKALIKRGLIVVSKKS